MPSVTCSNCSKKYRIDDSAAGRKFACKQCGSIVRVPAAATAPVVKTPPPPLPIETEETSSGDMDFNEMASLETTGEVDNSIPVMDETSVPAYTPSRTAIPKPAAKNRSGPRIGFRLNRGVLIVIGISVALLIFGGKEWLLASNASDTPQSITCADLAKNGPGNNLHVRVTNFLSLGSYVYFKKSNVDTWEKSWFAIVPPAVVKNGILHAMAGDKAVADDQVNAADIHVLIKSTHANSEQDLNAIGRGGSIDGMVINKIDSLDQEEKNKLHEVYPALDETTCYIVEEGRKPQGGLGTMMLLGGAVLALFGLFLMFKPST